MNSWSPSIIKHKDFCILHILITDGREVTVGYKRLSANSRLKINAILEILNVGVSAVLHLECGQKPLIGFRTKSGSKTEREMQTKQLERVMFATKCHSCQSGTKMALN